MKMSQLREGSFGRLWSQDVGMPVYLSTVRTPEGRGVVTGGFSIFWSDSQREEVGDACRSFLFNKFKIEVRITPVTNSLTSVYLIPGVRPKAHLIVEKSELNADITTLNPSQ
jgi:hypothetical protein